MSTVIQLRGLRLMCICGALPEEQDRRQRAGERAVERSHFESSSLRVDPVPDSARSRASLNG